MRKKLDWNKFIHYLHHCIANVLLIYGGVKLLRADPDVGLIFISICYLLHILADIQHFVLQNTRKIAEYMFKDSQNDD